MVLARSSLSRLPFSVPDPLASSLLGSFTAGCELSAALLSHRPEGPAATWDRTLSLADLIQRAGEAAGLAGADLPVYAAYHRDWIVRFVVLRAGGSEAKAREVFQLLEQRAVVLADALAAGGVITAAQRVKDLRDPWLSCVFAACRESGDRPALPDPFSSDPRFPVLLQIFHVLAGALGLQPLEEALALAVVARKGGAPAAAGPFVLTRPPLEPEPPRRTGPAAEAPAPVGHRAPWMLLLEAGSPGGRELVRRFQEDRGEDYGKCADALMLLRRHELGADRLARAAALLAEVRRQPLPEADAMGFVLGRFFYGSEAYYHYCAGDLDRAEEALGQAEESLRQAIDAEEPVAPCAPLNSDIPLQRARIAGRRQDWAGVERELSVLAALMTGRQPLHRFADGRPPVDYDSIARLCLADATLGEADREVLRQYLAPEHRVLELNRWIRSFYRPRGLLLLE